MRRLRLCCAVLTVASLLGLSVTAATKGGKSPAAEVVPGKVTHVLTTESQGPTNRRAALSALATSSHARWHAGYVKTGDAWQPFETAKPAEDQSALLSEYGARRAKCGANGDAHFALANWCRSNGLRGREEAHLHQVLILGSANHLAEAYQRLGYQAIHGTPVSPEERVEFGNVQQQAERSLQQWGPKLSKLLANLSETGRKRESAVAELESIRDPGAVPAIEWLMCGQDEPLANSAIGMLSNIKAHESTIALARQGVFNKWPSAREASVKAVGERKPEDFVPQLLGLLASPVVGGGAGLSVTRPGDPCQTTNTPGVLMYNYVLARETDDQFQVSTLRTIDFRSQNGADDLQVLSSDRRGDAALQELQGIRQDSSLRGGIDAKRAVRNEAYRLEKLVERENARTTELNGRVIKILKKVDDKTSTEPKREVAREEPQYWWDWWKKYNGKRSTKEKRVVVYRSERRLGNESRAPETQFVQPPPPPHVCLAAGTLVWTDAGPKEIEQLAAGDLVLSQSIETGELGYQPVLETTTTDPDPTFHLRVGTETLQATAGHRFWASGFGWKMVRDLKPGDLLHTATSTMLVESIAPAETVPTYNLLVPRTHNYFVGRIGLLTHDIQLPRPTNRKVPGLVEKP